MTVPPGGLVQQDGRGGGQVETLGPAGQGDADDQVEVGGDLGGQAAGLVAEDQGDRLGQGRPVGGGGGVRVGPDQAQAAFAQGGPQRRPGRAGDHGQVEQAAGGGPGRLGALEVDRPVGGDDGVGGEGVGRPEHGAGVAGVADLGQHADQAGRGRQGLQGADHAGQDRDQALGGGGGGQGGQHRLGHQGDLGAALAGLVDQAGVAGRGPLGGQQGV